MASHQQERADLKPMTCDPELSSKPSEGQLTNKEKVVFQKLAHPSAEIRASRSDNVADTLQELAETEMVGCLWQGLLKLVENKQRPTALTTSLNRRRGTWLASSAWSQVTLAAACLQSENH